MSNWHESFDTLTIQEIVEKLVKKCEAKPDASVNSTYKGLTIHLKKISTDDVLERWKIGLSKKGKSYPLKREWFQLILAWPAIIKEGLEMQPDKTELPKKRLFSKTFDIAFKFDINDYVDNVPVPGEVTELTEEGLEKWR
jgi:hypothetical protein